TLTVVLEQAAPVSEVSLSGRLEAAGAARWRLAWLLGFALTAAGGLAAAALAWRLTRQLQRPVDSLIKSAERIGQGDYTRPVEERERAGFDLLQSAQETRETLVRTRSGQTIPVSFTGSRIDSDDPQFQGNIFVARNITDRKRAERRIRYLARYDALTKIPNRMQFHHLLQQTIARALRAGQVVAVLYLD